MHSRIFELSNEPILPNDRMTECDIGEWFCSSVADYISTDCDRELDIQAFLNTIGYFVDIAEDGESFTFLPNAKQRYFERKYYDFMAKVRELTGISLDAFCGETQYDIGLAMCCLNNLYSDLYGFYIYYDGVLKGLDDWIRGTDLSGSFYFGGTLDYHC